MNRRAVDIIRNGKRFETEHFIFCWKYGDFPRAGFLMSGRYVNSVTRNRVKRIFRILVKNSLKKIDVVIRAKLNFEGITKEEIEREWEIFMRQVY